MSKNPTKEEIAKMPENNFPERLEKARKQKGLSVHALSEISGLSDTQIKRYRRGKNEPTYQSMEMLAVALGVTPEYLMRGHSQEDCDQQFQNLINSCPKEHRPALYQLIEIFIKSHTEGDTNVP